MVNKEEKDFILRWQEQKQGPKWKYYLQYIVAWSVVIFLSLLFLVKVIMEDRSMGGWLSFFIIFPASILMAAITTHLVYTTNEKKLQKIIDREKNL